MGIQIEDLSVGEIFSSDPVIMSRERMRWYCDALETAASQSGKFIVADPTIHSDDEFALANGLPGIVADGMLSTNYVSGLLYKHFGLNYLRSGALTTKFIRPVYEDEVLTANLEITGIENKTVSMNIWVNLPDETKVTVGTAEVTIDEVEA